MRGFFILLLLTNMVFFAWQYLERGKGSEIANIYHGIPIVNDGLTLLSELPPKEQPALREVVEDGADTENIVKDKASQSKVIDGKTVDAQEQSGMVGKEREVVSTGTAVCLRIEDIDGRTTLDQLLALLKANGAAAIEQGEKQVKKTNYWVMLPPYPTRAKADEAAAILNAKRVKDFFIVRSGEYENAVSLGVFSTRDRAQRRYEQIVGLKGRLRRPKIEAIELPAKRYFISYRLTDEASRMRLEQHMEKMKYPYNEEINCR